MESSLLMIFKEPTYIVLCVIFIISFILTCLIFLYSKRSVIKDTFIFKIIVNLIIVTTLHSLSYIVYYSISDSKSQTPPYSPLCYLQAILLISSCQTEEVWLMIITFVCYQGIINRKYYNMKHNFSLFMGFVICINFVYPLILMLVYYFSEVLGPFDTYCWVMKNYDRYSFALYILKFTNIILNCIMTIRMLIKVYKMDKSIEEKRNEITFCIKTIVFPVIQIVLNITMTFFKLFTNHIYIGSFLSSFNGIAYPFYIIFYTEIFRKKKNEETNEDIKDDSEMEKDSLFQIEDDNNKENKNELINSSLDYYK